MQIKTPVDRSVKITPLEALICEWDIFDMLLLLYTWWYSRRAAVVEL